MHANYKQEIVDADDTGTVMLNRKSTPCARSRVADIIARTVEGFHAIRREQWMRSACGDF